MPLCIKCSKITLTNLYPALDDEFANWNEAGNSKNEYRHWDSLEMLERSARSCSLCQLIVQALHDSKNVDGKNKVQPSPRSDEKASVVRLSLWPRPKHNGNARKADPLQASHVRINCGLMKTGTLVIYSDKDDPAVRAGDIIGRPMTLDPLSDSSVTTMKQWIHHCETKHHLCRPRTQVTADGSALVSSTEQNVRLPTRLVYVGTACDSQTIRILNTRGAYGVYCALSYCWGTIPFPTLTRNAINEHPSRSTLSVETDPRVVHEFSLDALPKTFRDAIHVTRALGIEYLWIDALCIIQDDAADWNAEAPLMSEVYNNAKLAISAMDAPNAMRGFLHKRPARPLSPVTVRYTSSRYHNAPCAMTLALGPRWGFSHFGAGHLNNRGWTLQERHLSRRKLYFGAEQIFFECQQCRLEECGTVWDAPMPNVMVEQEIPDEKEARLLAVKTWKSLVMLYSRRTLTVPSDKLPAVEGIAKAIASKYHDEYLAGVWKERLHCWVLWQGFGCVQYPSSPRAPSWSWAAVDGPIYYWFDPEIEEAVSSHPWIVETLDEGGRKDFSMRITMTTKRRTVIYSSDVPQWLVEDNVIWGRYLKVGANDKAGTGFLDVEPSTFPVVVQCIAISVKICAWGDTEYGVLFVEELEGRPSTFRRIGMGYIGDPELFSDVPEEEIHLI